MSITDITKLHNKLAVEQLNNVINLIEINNKKKTNQNKLVWEIIAKHNVLSYIYSDK